jgi:hypothetical protein
MMSSKSRRTLKDIARKQADIRDPIGMSPEQRLDWIREGLEYLEHKGLIYDTGRRRNGQIVYAATPDPKMEK